MSPLQRILIVDNGDRETDAALSADLAELGYASVTASLDAADEVLALIPTPTAIVLQMPRAAGPLERARFKQLAERLRARRDDGRAPVLLLEPETITAPGGFVRLLEAQVGAGVLARPEH